jgi:hypothetical protein
MGLHPEVPVVAFLGLVHLRIALLLSVLGRRGRVQNGCVYDHAGGDAHSPGLQVQIGRAQNLGPKSMFFQQMPKLAHRGFARRRLLPQIDPHESPHHRRVIQGLFHRRVRQVKPLLQKINPQHPLHSHRRAPIPRLGIMGFDERAHFSPRDNLFQFFQKYLFVVSFLCSAQNYSSSPDPSVVCSSISSGGNLLYIFCGKGDLIQSLPRAQWPTLFCPIGLHSSEYLLRANGCVHGPSMNNNLTKPGPQKEAQTSDFVK